MNILENIKDKELQNKVLLVRGLTFQKIEKVKELQSIYDEIKKSDDELYEHSMAVADISCLIGLYYNMRLDELINLYLGSVFHDNGKSMLNQNILYKPETFSADERQLVEAHTSLGRRRLSHIVKDGVILDIISKHHERLDGSGYPEGLDDMRQSIYVRIVSVADVYHALISKRCYKEAMDTDEAFKVLESDGFDQTIVTVLKTVLNK